MGLNRSYHTLSQPQLHRLGAPRQPGNASPGVLNVSWYTRRDNHFSCSFMLDSIHFCEVGSSRGISARSLTIIADKSQPLWKRLCLLAGQTVPDKAGISTDARPMHSIGQRENYMGRCQGRETLPPLTLMPTCEARGRLHRRGRLPAGPAYECVDGPRRRLDSSDDLRPFVC